MASPVPAKVQSLHNFSLSNLKWKTHSSNQQRSRVRLSDSPPLFDVGASSSTPMHGSAPRQSPVIDSGPVSDGVHASPLINMQPVADGSRISAPESIGHGNCVPSLSDRTVGGSGAKLNTSEGDVVRPSSKVYVRMPRRNKDNHQHSDEKKSLANKDEVKAQTAQLEIQESVEKTWNLRPRKSLRNTRNGNGGSCLLEKNPQSSQGIQNRPELSSNREERKRKFSIALCKEDIEEDIFALTGSKPTRKPKKRSRVVQKALDKILPGMRLTPITPYTYKVPKNYHKV